MLGRGVEVGVATKGNWVEQQLHQISWRERNTHWSNAWNRREMPNSMENRNESPRTRSWENLRTGLRRSEQIRTGGGVQGTEAEAGSISRSGQTLLYETLTRKVGIHHDDDDENEEAALEICLTDVDADKDSFAFSFAGSENVVKVCEWFGWNPAYGPDHTQAVSNICLWVFFCLVATIASSDFTRLVLKVWIFKRV